MEGEKVGQGLVRKANRRQAAEKTLLTALKLLHPPGTEQVLAVKEVVDAWRQPEDAADESLQSVIDRTLERQLEQFARLDQAYGQRIQGDGISIARAAVVDFLDAYPLTYEIIEAAEFDPQKVTLNQERPLRSFLSQVALLDQPAASYAVRFFELVIRQTVAIARTSSPMAREVNLRTFLATQRASERFDDAFAKIFLPELRRGTTEEIAKFEAAYLEVLVRQFGETRLLGLEDVPPALSTAPLDVTYISLNSSVPIPPDLLEHWSQSQPKSSVSRATRSASRTVEEVIGGLLSKLPARRGLRLSVSGVAGSGKTTLAHWLATRIGMSHQGEGAVPAPLESLRLLVPFVVPLRSVYRDGGRSPTIDALLGELLVPEPRPGDWLTDCLTSGRAFVILDGLDEVPPGRVEDARRWIANLSKTYPRVHLVVTGRPESVDEDYLSRQRFTLVGLSSLEAWQTRSVVDHWFDAQCDGVPRGRAMRYREQQAKLVHALSTDPTVADLGQTPLLASVLAVYYVNNTADRPVERLRLIEGVCYTLIYGREAAKDMIPSHMRAFGYEERISLLGQIALAMFEAGVSELAASSSGVDERLEIAGERVKLQLGNPSLDPEQCAAYLLKRSTIFFKPLPHAAGFVHRMFLEYVLARRLVHRGAMERLLDAAGQPGWYSVVSFFAASAPDVVTQQLISHLMERLPRLPDRRRAIYCLATCMASVTTDEAELYTAVAELVREELPPADEEEINLLATMGSRVLHLLPPPSTIREKAAYIATCAKIHSDDALDLIAALTSGVERQELLDEAVRAWRSFPAERYARKVLAQLDCSDVTIPVHSAEAARSVHLLTCGGLRLDSCEGLADLTWLERTRGVRELDLSSVAHIDSLAGIEHVAATLRSLSLPNNGKVVDLAQLSTVTGLTHFRARNAAGLESVAELVNLPLESIDCKSLAPGLLDELLRRGDMLTCLTLTKVELDASCLPGRATRLQKLSVSDSQLSGQLDLSSCAALDVLELRVGAKDLSVVLPLPGNLNDLVVDAYWGNVSLHHIDTQPELESLYMSGTVGVEDGSAGGPQRSKWRLVRLAGSPKLRRLSVRESSELGDAYGVHLLRQLEELDLTGTMISALSGQYVNDIARHVSRNKEGEFVLDDADAAHVETWDIGSCTELRRLTLDRCVNLQQLSGLSKCRNLELVSLHGIADDMLIENVKYWVPVGAEVKFDHELFFQETG